MNEKMKLMKKESVAVREFIMWLKDQQNLDVEDQLGRSTENIIRSFYGINEHELEKERVQMLDKQRELNERRERGEKPGSSVLDKKRR